MSKLNSSLDARRHLPGTHPFDLKDARKDLANRGFPDGPNFKGRGFVLLAGRGNYTRYEKFFGWPLVDKPDLANDPWAAAALLGQIYSRSRIRNSCGVAPRRFESSAPGRQWGTNGWEVFAKAMKDGRQYLQQMVAGDVKTRLVALAGERYEHYSTLAEDIL